jgi:arsenite methyltransferase
MTDSNADAPPRADYGLDAPGVIRILLVCGIISLVAGLVWSRVTVGVTVKGHVAIVPTLEWIGWGCLIGSGLMVASSRWGKLKARDRLLGRMKLTGAETVLDVGCGHGLMLIGAAKRVPHGRAIGVDLWSQIDQKDNSSVATLANARAEGVADRVEVRDGDMRALPLDDASVDVVLSCLAIHNVAGRAERRKAIGEIVRVLKPGGQVGIIDIGHVSEYASDLRAAGMSSVTTHGFSPWIYPPCRVLTAVR